MPTAVRSSHVTGAWINDEATNTQLAGLLAATHTKWSAATNGSQSAAAPRNRLRHIGDGHWRLER